MAFTTSPNMQLQIPGVGTEAGPQYATDVNNSLNIIDSHNHSVGSGVLITPAGLDINTDLPINGNSVTLLFTARFQSQSAPIPNASPNIGCLYVNGNELYYNDYSGGHEVQITNNGVVNAGAGSISGLPSGTASVTFSASTYVFQSATNVAANIDVASVILRNTVPGSNGLTLSPPSALGANYTISLPPANPLGQLGLLTYSTANNIGSVAVDNSTLTLSGTLRVASQGITATQIANNTITAAQIANNTITGSQIQSGVALQGYPTVSGRYVTTVNTNQSYPLATIYATINSSGSVVQGNTNLSVSNPSTGNYSIGFDTPFTGTPVVVACSVINTNVVATVTNQTTSNCNIALTNGATGGFIEAAFSFFAIGQMA